MNMKVNGYILTYPLGYTNIEGSSGNDLQALLKMKANLVQTAGQDTPDDEIDDKFLVDPKELPSNEDNNWIEV